MANRSYNFTKSYTPEAYITYANIIDVDATSATIIQAIKMKELSVSPAHKSGYGKIYAKDDNNLYFKDETGLENQLNASNFSGSNWFSIGGQLPGAYPVLRRCTIDSTSGLIVSFTGMDIMFNSDNDDTPDQEIIAERVWNAVWNDIADFQLLHKDESLIPGKCYYDTFDGAKICDEYCQKSVIGIASDTFGYGVGVGNKDNVPFAIAGWVLAFVDREYESGIPLTNNEDGNLTEMDRDDVMTYPERIVAIYKKPEKSLTWGPKGKEIKVRERHWVKVK